LTSRPSPAAHRQRHEKTPEPAHRETGRIERLVMAKTLADNGRGDDLVDLTRSNLWA
jgi:hypothetical protein